MADTFEEARAKAHDALAKGDARAAFSAIRPHLEFPGGLREGTDWEEGLELFSRVATALKDDAFAKLLLDTSRTYNDPHSLFDLGEALLEKSLPGIAATVLSRANQLAPGKGRLLDALGWALIGSGHGEEANRILRDAGDLVDQSFVLQFLTSFTAILSRDLEEPRRRLPALLAGAANPKSSEFPAMAHTIEGMLARADAVRGATPLDEKDLRGWQFVVNGTLLLHLSPHGFDEGMRGRYALVQDSNALCLEGVRRLTAVYEAIDARPPRVFLLPDRPSEILARATSEALAIPAEEWPKEGTKAPGLIVAYDLDVIPQEVWKTFSDHTPGQHLHVHATRWIERAPFAADMTTCLHQAMVSPWEGGLHADSKTGKLERGRPAEGTREDLAKAVLSSKLGPDALADLPSLVSLSKAACKMEGPYAPGLVRSEGKRRRFWVESPVHSNRFA